MASQLATFGAGCFWGVELDFRVVAGVIDALVGYEGGSTLNPTYHDVCTGDTGHAEVIQVVFDPELVSYDHLLDVFFQLHDPTTLNRNFSSLAPATGGAEPRRVSTTRASPLTSAH